MIIYFLIEVFRLNINQSSIAMATSTKKSSKRTTKDPCWSGYEQVGMKIKGGKRVPNCVPKKKKSSSQ